MILGKKSNPDFTIPGKVTAFTLFYLFVGLRMFTPFDSKIRGPMASYQGPATVSALSEALPRLAQVLVDLMRSVACLVFDMGVARWFEVPFSGRLKGRTKGTPPV